MKKLYRVRLFRIMDEVDSSKYEVYGFGSIIVSKTKKDCKEYLYELNIPVVDSKLECDFTNNIPMNIVTIPLDNLKSEYIVLKDDFNEKNRIKTKNDLLKCNFDSRINPTMGVVERLKKLEDFEKGVVYEKNRRS